MTLQVAANHSVASDRPTAADARLRGCLTVAAQLLNSYSLGYSV